MGIPKPVAFPKLAEFGNPCNMPLGNNDEGGEFRPRELGCLPNDIASAIAAICDVTDIAGD